MGGIASWMLRIKKHGLPKGCLFDVVNTCMHGRKIHERVKFSSLEIKRNINIYKKLKCKLSYFKPDVVHYNVSLSALSVIRHYILFRVIAHCNVKIVAHYRGNLVEPIGKCRRLFYFNFLLKKLVGMSSLSLVQNRGSYKVLANIYPDKTSAMLVFPGFIDDEIFSVRNFDDRERGGKAVTAIFSGAISCSKGCDKILEIAKKLPSLKVLMAGEIKSDMKDAFDSRPKNVNYLGALDNALLIKEMAKADFFLFPTVHPEGFPNSIVEAMAIGLPIISTNIGAISEMVDDGKGGYLIDPGAISDFVVKTKEMMASSEMRISMGAYNHDKAQNEYAYSKVVQQLVGLYKSTVLGVSEL
jgi:glycosyltransferase involved in cell wall biosynthesis